jgi:hypothetical protein
MAKQLINLGTPNGRDGDTVRVAFGKINENLKKFTKKMKTNFSVLVTTKMVDSMTQTKWTCLT